MSFRDRLRKFQLTQLSQIKVASPCSVDWDTMEGDEKVRFCSQCQLHVFNLSAMDAEEAGARVAEHTEDLCVRFYRRADGTMLTRDCPVGVAQKRTRRRERLQATATFTVGALLTGAIIMPTQGAVARPAARRTMMYSAIKTCDLGTLTALLDRDHDPEATSSNGTTLLMRAAKVGNLEAARLLLERGADVHARDHEGRTPLAIALAEKRWKVATFLKNAGATQ